MKCLSVVRAGRKPGILRAAPSFPGPPPITHLPVNLYVRVRSHMRVRRLFAFSQSAVTVSVAQRASVFAQGSVRGSRSRSGLGFIEARCERDPVTIGDVPDPFRAVRRGQKVA